MRLRLAILLCLALSACASKTVTVSAVGSPVTSSPSAAPSPTYSPSSSTYEPPAPDPKPDARYSHSCDYLLGNFQDYSPNGFRFIAEARLNNTGNVGAVVEVTAHWDQVGTHPITMTKTVKLPYGRKGLGRVYEACESEQH